jgi:hypothetical protein
MAFSGRDRNHVLLHFDDVHAVGAGVVDRADRSHAGRMVLAKIKGNA